MIKMVVFDMAGTTVDEDNIVYKTLLKTINDAGYDFSLEQVLATGAGKEKLTAIKDIIALSGAIPLEQLTNKIYSAFTTELAAAYDKFELQPQPGAETLFNELKKKNILVVLNTGYNEITAGSILEKLGWKVGVHIDALITASDVSKNRPKPDMILLAMQQFDITDGNEVIKVGDSIIDIEEGKNAGCHLSIGITSGAHSYEQLASANPHHIINHLSELLPLL
ncbi:phosphonatase-like hydrolase [Ferruginibacter sp. SUN106]|uniref:phosphonatase-like hydrolase n=1 Tax=Ferruginibacter sp. SUN106 TaxID=2978348 RepID=UPI003D35ACDA